MCGRSCCDFTGVINPECLKDTDTGEDIGCPNLFVCRDNPTEPNYNCDSSVDEANRWKYKCCDEGLGTEVCTELGTNQHCSDCNPCDADKQCVPVAGQNAFQCVCKISKS